MCNESGRYKYTNELCLSWKTEGKGVREREKGEGKACETLYVSR